jgi:phosphoglycolate phosphatase-like HAD superfamily hydrolase
MLNLKPYKTLVFDCDGVILDSNKLKTQAYYDTAISYGANKAQAQALVDHHVQYGGISRYPKYELFLREIMGQTVTDEALKTLLERFAYEIHRGLLNCKMAPELEDLREATPDARWMLVSGGDQAELRTLFAERGIDGIFDAGIFGSPDNKDMILAREIANGNLAMQAIFFGDSRYDHQAAIRAGLDFVFVSGWTELGEWQKYCAENNIDVIESLAAVL